MSKKRIEMTVKMQVTPSQALALQAMFKLWNFLGSAGSSRMVAFYVDGDGDFKPKCDIQFSELLPELTEELEKAALIGEQTKCDFAFDYDPIAWKLSEKEKRNAESNAPKN